MQQHFIFLTSFDATEAIQLSLDKQLVVKEAQSGQLDQMSTWPSTDQINIVLADQLVSNYELDLKARNQSQLMKAARYAVEEKFPGRLEDYHIVTQKGPRHGVSVRAIKLQRLKDLLQRLTTYNINPNHVYVESDLLNPNLATLLFGENEATLCGDGLEQTYEFDSNLIPMIAERIFSALDKSKELQIIYKPEQKLVVEALENQAPESIRIKKILKNERYYETLCQNKRTGVNLLKGEFAVASDSSLEQSFWKYPAWLAAASIAVFSGGLFAQNLLLANRADQQEQQLIEAYSEIFAGSAKPRDAVDVANKLKIKSKLSSSNSAVSLPIDALELLKLTEEAARGNPVQILGLSLDSSSAELLVSGQTVEVLNKFKQDLDSRINQNNTLSMDTVTSKDDFYQGKISIR